MDTFKDRVLSLWPDKSIAKIAESIEITHMGLSRVFREGKLPKADTLLNIHNQSGCDLKWLMTGEGEPFPNGAAQQSTNTPLRVVSAPAFDVLGNQVDIDEFVFIPRYDVKAAAGHGRFNESEKPLYTMAFRRDWVENYLDIKPENLFVIGVVGDSMEGV